LYFYFNMADANDGSDDDLFAILPIPREYKYRPGWIAFVQGECSEEQYQDLNPAIKDIMHQVMYPFHHFNYNYYYHLGHDRFSWQVTRKVEERKLLQREFERPDKLRPYITFFYNRQLIIQMTYIPKLYPGQEVSIPLTKSPAMEIQVDTMHFLPAQQDRVGNYNTLGLIVILEPYSRFMWVYPYGKIERGDERQKSGIGAEQALHAFEQAFQTNGPDAQQFYNYLRDKIKRVVTDRGTEFQGEFARGFRSVFPNATLYYATPKAYTFGRPTNTGPVEISIGTLRRVLRDFEIAIDRKFIGNNRDRDIMKYLRQVVYSYNNTGQLSTLRGPDRLRHEAGRKRRPTFTPQRVAEFTINEMEGLTALSQFMTSQRNKKIEKYKNILDKYEMDAPLQGAYVRLYYPPPPLSKLVRFRVSLELYRVVRIYPANNSMVAEIQNVESNETKKDIGLKRLVLVKPLLEGEEGSPEVIQRGLRQVVNEQLNNQQAVQRANDRHDVIRNNVDINNAIMGQANNQNLPRQPGPPRNGVGQQAGGPQRRSGRDRVPNRRYAP
jgi:uncharacterized protein YjgD (DUF1641 family)